MARAIRMEYAGAVYLVTARGNWRKRIFGDDADHERFLEYVGGSGVRDARPVTSAFIITSS